MEPDVRLTRDGEFPGPEFLTKVSRCLDPIEPFEEPRIFLISCDGWLPQRQGCVPTEQIARPELMETAFHFSRRSGSVTWSRGEEITKESFQDDWALRRDVRIAEELLSQDVTESLSLEVVLSGQEERQNSPERVEVGPIVNHVPADGFRRRVARSVHPGFGAGRDASAQVDEQDTRRGG